MKNLFSNLRGDLFGGLTAGIVALPLALAFGVSSGMGPSAGLYGAIFISFFAALFGGTSTQISGPTAPMTAVSMVVIAAIVAANDGDLTKALPAILTVFLLAGLIQVGLGISGIGKYIKFIPYPVVSGFMTAIGVIILITQVLPLLGYYAQDDADLVKSFRPQAKEVILDKIYKKQTSDGLVINDFKRSWENGALIQNTEVEKEAKNLAKKSASGVVGAIKTLPRALKNINVTELLLALATILIIFGFKRITTAVPSTLVALLAVSGVAYFCKIDYISIQKIPDGFPEINTEIFTSFELGSITPYIFTAITLALLGAIDSLLTSVVADNMTKTKHKPNKELIGQGIGNSIAALFGGIPGAGATIRTVVNINAGGKTKISGMFAGILLLIILLLLGPVASQIPAAVLAGILITVGIGVMDYKGLKAIPKLPRDIDLKVFSLSSEVLIMFIVMILSVFWNLVNAVGIGLIIAALIFMKKMSDLTAENSDIKPIKEEEAWPDEMNFPEALKEEVFIKHIKGPLFFGVTSEFQQLSEQTPENCSAIIIRMDRVPYMDQSGLYAMEDVLFGLVEEGKKVCFVGLKGQPKYMLTRIDIIPDLVPDSQLFNSFEDCLVWIKNNVKNAI